MNGSIHLHPPHAFMASTETIFTLLYLHTLHYKASIDDLAL